MVGLLHGLQRDGQYAVSMNARDNGGNVFETLVDELTLGGRCPTHLLRSVFESANTYDDAVQMLGNNRLVNPVYYIVSGVKDAGTLIQRARMGFESKYYDLHDTAARGSYEPMPAWFKLQTNYDFAEAEPSYDARKKPGIDHLLQAGQGEGATEQGLEKILETQPTFNDHTDMTAIITPATGYYKDLVWFRDGIEMAFQTKKLKEETFIYV